MSSQTVSPAAVRSTPTTSAIPVTVIIPVRDGADYLRRTLPALRRELPAGWEIIVANDHSTDDSEAVARQFADQVVLSAVNGSDMEARNSAVPLAGGKVLLFLDADILVTRDALEALVAGLRAPGVTMTVGIYSDGPDLKSLCGRYKTIWVRYSYLQSSRELRWMNTAFAAISRADFMAVGDYEAFEGCRRGGSDIDFGRRIVENGGRVVLLKDVACDHLKEMTLVDLLRNDYNRSRGFFRMAVQSGEIRRVAGARPYGNISPGFMLGVVSATLVPAGLLLAAFQPAPGLALAAGALLAQQACGLGFMRYAAPRLGLGTLLLPAIYLIDQMTCALGLAVECARMLLKPRPRPLPTPMRSPAESATVSDARAS